MSAKGCAGWRITHRAVTGSTNVDALAGKPGDVFTADMQTDGKGRLDHRWISPPGENLMMSAVVDVSGMAPDAVMTLPLVAGLAVANAISGILSVRCATDAAQDARIKWPNDILIGGRKVCGILCGRSGDNAIVGIGVNVNQTQFAAEIADRATSLRIAASQGGNEGRQPVITVAEVRDAVLCRLRDALTAWRERGFAEVLPEIARFDFLKGRVVSVMRTDGDDAPACGVCGGISADGSLDVGGEAIYAGEAHVL